MFSKYIYTLLYISTVVYILYVFQAPGKLDKHNAF